MLNPFPQLLFLGFFAPTILRAAVAIVLFYLAYHQWKRRAEISDVRHSAFPTISIIFNVVVGAGLLLGYYTQLAALLAILGFIFGLWMNRRHPKIVILPDSTVVLLIAMCVSVLITGAGAYAMDLPL